jgi:hypothetical protein
MSVSFKEYIEISQGDNENKKFNEVFGGSKVDALLKAKSFLESQENIQAERLSTNQINKRYKIFLDIEHLCFAQFIAVESYISSYKEGNENDIIAHIAAECLRPLHEKEYNNDNEDDNRAHLEAIYEENAEDVVWYYQNMLKSRKSFHFAKYRDVFFFEKEEWEIEEEKNMAQVADTEKSFFANWYWYDWVRQLAHEDVLRYDAVLKLPMSVVAPECSYIQGLRKIEKQRMAEEEIKARVASGR